MNDLYTMKKRSKAKVQSFSIPTDIGEDFSSYCKAQGLNKSQVVTKLLEIYLQNAGVRK